jgi:ABC-2 type transport system ATP-binding protein
MTSLSARSPGAGAPLGWSDSAGGIEVSDLCKSYGRTRALNGISLSVGTGATGLLGPNGAGKTTLLQILATVLASDSGRVSVLGGDPSDPQQRLQIRRRLGYLPQELGFQRGFTAFEFVDYVAILKELTHRRERHDEVRRVIAEVGLESVSNKQIRKLSGGMRRRLGLAQALLTEPALLVLDEPTVGLDPEQRLRFRELISRAGESRTVLLSTHQTEDVAALCGTVIVISSGGTLFSGSPAELVAQAAGRVWLTTTRSPEARVAWRVGDGRYRNIGDAPQGADLAEPAIEDAYLLLVGDAALAGDRS